MESDFQLFHCALLHILPIYFFCGGKFQLSVCRSMNPLFDVALCRSTPAYYTAVSTAKLEQRSFCSAQNPASFGVKLAYGVVFAGNPSKEKAWNFSVHQEVSGFVSLKLEIYCSIGFIVGILSEISLQRFVMLHNRVFTCNPGIHNPSWFAAILVVLLSICCPWKNFAVRQNAQ